MSLAFVQESGVYCNDYVLCFATLLHLDFRTESGLPCKGFVWRKGSKSSLDQKPVSRYCKGSMVIRSLMYRRCVKAVAFEDRLKHWLLRSGTGRTRGLGCTQPSPQHVFPGFVARPQAKSHKPQKTKAADAALLR